MVTTGTVLVAFCRSFYETQKACEVSVISIPISEIWRLKHKASSFVLSDLGGRGEVWFCMQLATVWYPCSSRCSAPPASLSGAA